MGEYNRLVIEFNRACKNGEKPSADWIQDWAVKARDLMDQGGLTENQQAVLAGRLEQLGCGQSITH